MAGKGCNNTEGLSYLVLDSRSASVWVTSSLTTVLQPTTIALGNFDGIHGGHARVIGPVVEAARALNQQERDPILDDRTENGTQGLALEQVRPTVVSFYPHPQVVLRGIDRAALTPTDEKARCLQRLGVEQLVLLPFNQSLRQLSPEAFLEQILLEQLQGRMIAVGEDFRFGRGRAGTAIALRDLAAKFGVPVTIVSLETAGGDRISSSRIRDCLATGDVHTVHQLLGRPYELTGRVVKGQQLGRTLGFPTANLQVEADKLLPRFGVYGVRAVLESGDSESGETVGGVMNVGCRPTVAGQAPTVEVHLFDWSGDLYGQVLTVHLMGFIRPERAFDSLEALKAQITQDCLTARDQVAIACS
ncbi:MAG: bifunctional riboflavin kinase/FAD synthetase [Cyanobacteria bacterium P01_H01_bin.130]